MDLEDRQVLAVTALGVLGLALPILILFGCALAMGWAAVLGAHDVHGSVFGWLSERHADQRGHTVWQIGSVVWEYFLGVVSTYVLYQLGELLASGFRAFREALA